MKRIVVVGSIVVAILAIGIWQSGGWKKNNRARANDDNTTGSSNLDATAASLTVHVFANASDAKIRVALFTDPATFPDSDQAIAVQSVSADDGQAQAVFQQVAPGTYAVAVYQDLNDDHVLNRNLVGVPSEPYGFSNNVRGSFGPPDFAAASFSMYEIDQTVQVSLSGANTSN